MAETPRAADALVTPRTAHRAVPTARGAGPPRAPGTARADEDAGTVAAEPSRRGVLLLLGATAMAPAALALVGAAPRRVDVDGLRFDVLAVTRQALTGHARHSGPVALSEAMSWPDVVRVQLRVHNVAALPLLLSPGQFRLRVGGLTVMPTAWRHGPAALAAGASLTGWIDYRAPADEGLLDLEFTPAGRTEAVTVPLAVPLALPPSLTGATS